MKTTKISNRTIMFTEKMAWDGTLLDLNLALILGARHNYIIDTGLGCGSVAPIINYIKSNKKSTIVVNTHHDFDHVWGNCAFENSFIISHKTCLDFLEAKWDESFKAHSCLANGAVHKCLPNLAFDKSLSFDDGVEIFHTPGHTAGCISVYDAVDKVLHAGDNIGDSNEEIVPYINTDRDTFKQLIETYRRYDFEICLSGHNSPQPKSVLDKMQSQLNLGG